MLTHKNNIRFIPFCKSTQQEKVKINCNASKSAQCFRFKKKKKEREIKYNKRKYIIMDCCSTVLSHTGGQKKIVNKLFFKQRKKNVKFKRTSGKTIKSFILKI
jgi:hypothetical protein